MDDQGQQPQVPGGSGMPVSEPQQPAGGPSAPAPSTPPAEPVSPVQQPAGGSAPGMGQQ